MNHTAECWRNTGFRINKLLPIVPPREQRAEIKDGHCCCQGHLIRAIYFLDLLIAELFTGVLKQQKLTGTIREISRLGPSCHFLTLKTSHSEVFFCFNSMFLFYSFIMFVILV